jgi:hypothetical protein
MMALMRSPRHRGVERDGRMFTFGGTVDNLVRIHKLTAAAA